jgi:NADPH:quinone reductase-like Zn-dependent oxidoreductase
MSFETAAALPVNYLTAWLMLVHLANVRSGDRVLVHAAAGGVGIAAVQLCRWRGAEILGTASGSKHDRLRAMGVAHCIDYREEDFEDAVHRITNGRGVDLVLDSVGGKSFKKSYRCLAPLGRLICFGVSSLAPSRKRRLATVLLGLARMPRFGPAPLMNDNRGVLGVNLGHLWDHPLLPIALREIVELTTKGTLAPVVDRVFPLAEAAAAHAYIQERRNFGKVLLAP